LGSGDKKVTVIWDSGRELRYRAGENGKYDLRVFDTAPSGMKGEITLSYINCIHKTYHRQTCQSTGTHYPDSKPTSLCSYSKRCMFSREAINTNFKGVVVVMIEW